MTEKGIAWDLSEIFSSCDDPKIKEKMDTLIAKADVMKKNYKDKINIPTFTAQNLHDLLKKQEEILADVEDIEVFSDNTFYANTTLPETKAVFNRCQDFRSSISKRLVFIELEIGKFIYENPEIINKEILGNYKNYLSKVKRRFPHKLSVKEEELIIEKDQFGAIAWEQLRDSWLGSRKFKATIEGEEKVISISDFHHLMIHPDWETRASVYKSVLGLIGKDNDVISSALRNICGDWMNIVNRRKFNSPIHPSFIDFNTTQIIIDNLMKTVENKIHIFRRFLKIKAKLLNLTKLHEVDLIRLPFKKKITWKEVKELIIQIFSNFDEEFGELVSETFDRNHIDACTREGKIGGAYCSPWYNGKTVFILAPFKDLFNEVFSLVHELGHGIHFLLSSRNQTFINYLTGPLVAETASIFGVLLLTEHLLKSPESTDNKITILANELTVTGYVLFEVGARMWFEQSLYNAIEKGEFLDGNTISKYWCVARDRIYGDTVEWFDEMKWDWALTPHYFYSNRKFYNYSYVYGKLFVYALYQTYKNEGETFVPKYKKFLSMGGSLSPEELSKIVGLDITKPEFWQLGMTQFEEFVDELEDLIK